MSVVPTTFDWYQATVFAAPEAILRTLEGEIPVPLKRSEGKGQNSFKSCVSLLSEDGEVYASVSHGGVNPHPNVKSTGDHAPALAAVLRSIYPRHRVSRLDIKNDYRGETAFDDTVRLMGIGGRRFRLKGEKIIPDDLDDGSTYYLGSPKSALRLRCYEKGKQLFKFTGDPLWRELFDWTRLELQVRPQKDFKLTAARMAPEEFWGCAPWTRSIAAGVLDMNPEQVTMKPTRVADHERAMRFLTAQYGATLIRQADKLGSWDAVIDDLKARLGLDIDVAA